MYSVYLLCILISTTFASPRVEKFEARPENFETMAEVRDYLKQFSNYQEPEDDKEFWETESYKESLKRFGFRKNEKFYIYFS